jgi:intracellular septation protein A
MGPFLLGYFFVFCAVVAIAIRHRPSRMITVPVAVIMGVLPIALVLLLLHAFAHSGAWGMDAARVPVRSP